MRPHVVHIAGGGLAGSEVAYQLAKRNIKVVLHEMRPNKMTPVHKTSLLAELVCSNSLKSDSLDNASGLLKRELELLGSMLLRVARQTAVPAGKALAVDRDLFSKYVTEQVIKAGVEIIREEVSEIPADNNIWIVATGPATSDALTKWLNNVVGEHLYFFDAVAPIVTAESIDYSKVFFSDRYGVGTADYINCPMNQEEYERFYEALVSAKVLPVEGFDSSLLFERCKPIEEIAKTGKQALLFGPLRPVGLVDPRTNRRPYAVVQLRKDNLDGTLYNLVGFQTRLTWDEQKRVIRMIPGLENAEIVRYGVMHRNLYIDSRKVLNQFLQLKRDPRIFFAGQITGVEGYVESIATGLYVSINVFRMLSGKDMVEFPRKTMVGSLIYYVTQAKVGKLQPMYANFGLLGIEKANRENVARTCLDALAEFAKAVDWE